MTLIHVLGKPTDAQRAAFKRAKAALEITEPLQFTAAEPGCGKVVSFTTEAPDFFCDYAIMLSDREQAARDILLWAVGGSRDNRVHSGVEFLNRIFAGGVREVGR